MKPKVVILGEKPQGTNWLKHVKKSGLFEIVCGCTRMNKTSVWWGGDCFEEVLIANNIPCVDRKKLIDIDYDILFSFTYPFIIEPEIIKKAKVAINLHEAPLPKHRGCNGYSHAILDDEYEYGTSLHTMRAELDSGELIAQKRFRIMPYETNKELYMRTVEYSTRLLDENMESISRFDFLRTDLQTQNEEIKARNSLDDLKMISASEIDNRSLLFRYARAFDFMPFEPAYFILNNRKYYIFINNSLSREDHNMQNCIISDKKSITEAINKSSSTMHIVPFELRELVIMEATEYERQYSIFGK